MAVRIGFTMFWQAVDSYRVSGEPTTSCPIAFECFESDLSHLVARYLPDLIKGDFDSLRPDVEEFYKSFKNVKIEQDSDQNSTDLMKCVSSLFDKETQDGSDQYDIVILGGLSGRLDQTIHTLSYLHKLRKYRDRVFAITDGSVVWVLDSGEHEIVINHDVLGKTCGLLPLGIDSTVLTTTGLRWNLTEQESSLDGLLSTSNHLLPEEPVVHIKTTRPVLWTAELRTAGIEAQ